MSTTRKITFPDNVEITKVGYYDKFIIIEFEPELIETPKPEPFIPKDGDFCTLKSIGYVEFLIFKSTESSFINFYFRFYEGSNNLHINNYSFLPSNSALTSSTDAEKQTLLDEIDKAGFIWNDQKKRIEKKSAIKVNDEYYYFTGYFEIEGDIRTKHDPNYDAGNCFQTEKQATEAAELVRGLLYHFHQEDEVLTKIKELLK